MPPAPNPGGLAHAEARFDPPPQDGRARVVVENLSPIVDGDDQARVKRVRGDRITVEADLLVDGHDKLAGRLLWRKVEPNQPDRPFAETPLEPVPNVSDRWRASFTADDIGTWQYAVEAWVDRYATWLWGLERKAAAAQDLTLELREGAALVAAAAKRASGMAAEELVAAARALTSELPQSERVALAASPGLRGLMDRHPDRGAAARHPPRELVVDPERARFSAWYELFPRSAGAPGKHGTLRDVEARLPYVAEMGFDILYLPPIHPIGRAHRKGPNNTLTPGPDDPGSPWAIGGSEGGHKAIHPELGSFDEFDRLVERARALGIDVALDIAFQASPDHPYVKQHPEWFVARADGSIQYAENPPKKYQDVYPFDFGSRDWWGLWQELVSVFQFWIGHGVRVFRVDNPHTKPLPFWRWAIDQIKTRHPEVIFLSEAFTRPKLMYGLAKAGFTQSYTYFTWRTTKAELTAFMTELVRPDIAAFYRPNLWPNTPDILPEHLQLGTRATFISRLVLAGTLSSSYGIYGPPFELMERTPRPGAEEYVDNEKYQIRQWDLDRPDSLRPVIRRLNQIRRDNPALQRNDDLRFHHVDNDLIIAYSKRSADGENVVLVVVSLDGRHRQAGWLDLDLAALGVGEHEAFQVHDLLSDARFLWGGRRAFVELDPEVMPAHIFRLRRHRRSEQSFEYYL